MNEKIKKIYIDGMTCVHCEHKIEATLFETPGIIETKVSYDDGTAIVAYDDGIISYEKILDIIKELDYTPKNETENEAKQAKKLPAWVSLSGVLIIMVGAFIVFNRLGVFDFINVFPAANEETSLGMLFVIGLLTSVHCAAMCGGFNVSQCVVKENPSDDADSHKPLQAESGANAEIKSVIKENTSDNADSHKTTRTERDANAKTKINIKTFRASFLYNLGRVVSYTVIGFIVGALGSAFTLSDAGRGVVAIIAAIFMIIMGLNMTGLFPSLRKLTPRMPKFIAEFIGKQKKKNNFPLVVGLLNGLMPCGPLQTMQIYALSTGNPLLGALSMFLFSLGTVPLMFGVGALSAILTKKFAKKIMTVGAALVVVMGMSMFNNGAALSGAPLPGFLGGTGPVVESVVDYDNNLQTVSFDLEANGYSAIKVKKGIPIVWVIRADDENLNGCNNEIKISALNITKKLEIGENIIEFIPENVGTIPFSCWMGMKRSKIIVV
jgi:sulfite exporter TauE/SafE/copper chaperone CopZ